MAPDIDGHNVHAGSITIIENKWFPKASAFGGSRAEPWPCFLGKITKSGWCILSNEPDPDRNDGTKYCRHSGLVQDA